jgi:RES domain
MKLVELEHAVDFALPSPSILYRVQRLRSRRGSVVIGPLRLPPRGLLRNRFDLVDDEVAYFAESSETAVYETLARREATSLSVSIVAGRALLTFQTTAPLRLLDLRFHAGAWPVLQSLRYVETQELAREARALGYDGLVYRSAQQYGSDCIVLFGAGAMRCVKLVTKLPLVSATGALHRVAAEAIRGAKVPLVP